MPTHKSFDRVPTAAHPDDLKVCECARCGCELMAPGQDALVRVLRSHLNGPSLPAAVAARVAGRPYCAACVSARLSGRSN